MGWDGMCVMAIFIWVGRGWDRCRDVCVCEFIDIEQMAGIVGVKGFVYMYVLSFVLLMICIYICVCVLLCAALHTPRCYLVSFRSFRFVPPQHSPHVL